MEDALGKIALTGATFVGKAAWSYAASVALKKISTFVNSDDQTINDNDAMRDLLKLDKKLSRKLLIANPIIDSIELAAVQGDTNFEGLLDLISEFKRELTHLSTNMHRLEPHQNLEKFKGVLDTLDDLLPLMQLSLQTRSYQPTKDINFNLKQLLEASSYLVTGDCIINLSTDKDSIKVGPDFPVRMYSLFEGSARKNANDFTWKEDFAKADCFIERKRERKFQLCVAESFDDGRFHEEDDQSARKRFIHIEQIQKMYYATSGKLLNLSESVLPVLVLKLATVNSSDDASGKPEWIALELYRADTVDEDTSDEESESNESVSVKESEEPDIAAMKMLQIADPEPSTVITKPIHEERTLGQLCLLEYLLRLCNLETREGVSHTTVSESCLSQYFENTKRNSHQPAELVVKPETKSVPNSPLAYRAPRLMQRFLAGSIEFLREYVVTWAAWS